ncbi:MAG: clan AA aspartic protease [Candidatus Kapabacteria bacterium]|jgi:clan AA aspartic protease|nr:clan AA aspartic protease [Candidatus Kapabacteria bacterium]
MGLTYATIELVRTTDLGLLEDGYITEDQVRKMEVRALVDSSAITLAINEKICRELKLKTLEKRTAVLADGSQMMTKVVGPVDVRCEGRETTVRAMVMPGETTEVLLGAMPLEGLDLVIDFNAQMHKNLSLIPNSPTDRICP